MRRAAKEVVKTILNRFGYAIFATGYRFTPWLEPDFQTEIYSKIRDRTSVTPDRCYILDRLGRHCSHLEGDFAECGVYQGGTAFLIGNVLQAARVDKTLHLFDTFAGMPDTVVRERDKHEKGDFGDTSRESVERYLAPFSHVVDIHAGFIPESFEEVKDAKFACVHIDVDIYQTAWDCCEFFYERLVKGAVMVFDDYGYVKYKDAEKRAVDEFFANKPEIVITLVTGQGMVIKL
jgi:O-methyltransferase